jgi:hypothetical protein
LHSSASTSSAGTPPPLLERPCSCLRLLRSKFPSLIEYKNDSAHEAQAKSQLKQPATTRSRADKAVARLAAANTSSAVHTNQLAELREKMQASGALSFISILCGLADLFIAAARLAALQRTLAAKRRLLLLLNVLETKHTLRTQRIKALTQKIDQLRWVRFLLTVPSQTD